MKQHDIEAISRQHSSEEREYLERRFGPNWIKLSHEARKAALYAFRYGGGISKLKSELGSIRQAIRNQWANTDG